MTSVVIADRALRKKRVSASALKRRRVRGPEGKFETVYVIEADKPDAGEQFRAVFQLNVNRARRSSKKPPVAAE